MPPRRSLATAFGLWPGSPLARSPRDLAASPTGPAGAPARRPPAAASAPVGPQRDTDLLQHALHSPNAGRAMATYDRMQTLAKESPGAASRLTMDLREALVRGVADRSSASDKGLKGVLGLRHAEAIARTLVAMPRADYEHLCATLDRAGLDPQGNAIGGADPHTERALILKAVGARAERLTAAPSGAGAAVGDGSARRQAMHEITAFAGDIRGMERNALVFKTTALDIVEGMECRNPLLGLANYQRYANTCSATIAQNIQAERDPIRAAGLRADFYEDDAPAKRQQKETYEKLRFLNDVFEEVDVPAEAAERWRADGTLPGGVREVAQGEAVSIVGTLVEKAAIPVLKKKLPPESFQLVWKYATNHLLSGAEQEQLKGVLDGLDAKMKFAHTRQAVEFAPVRNFLPEMRANYVRHPDGTTRLKGARDGAALWESLSDLAPAGIGQRWAARLTNIHVRQEDPTAGGLNDEDIAGLEAALEAGSDVPVTISGIDRTADGMEARNPHALMISDVRGEGAGRKYLVTDPSRGRTEWVPRDEMRDYGSRWPEKYFGQKGQGIHQMFYDR